jgi:hypothetical protein
MPVPRRLIAAINLAALVPAVTLAQSTWDGGGDGTSWSDAANWNPDGVPTASTDVLLDEGVTVVLDVAGTTRDLTLDGATIDGSGDLDVTGHLDWIDGTLGGAGTTTLTGGLTFADGPDKLIGRAIEAMCDVTWEPSTLLFDTDVEATFHHHAGFSFVITDQVPRSPGSERRGAGHLAAPAVGAVDPDLDLVDRYSFFLDGDLEARVDVTVRMSTDVGGTYTQTEGTTTTFDGGSRIRADAVYGMGQGTVTELRRGTHVFQGQIFEMTPGEGDIPVVRVTDAATGLLVQSFFAFPMSFTLESDMTLEQDATFQEIRVTGDEVTISGPGALSAERVVVVPGLSDGNLSFFNFPSAIGRVDWFEGGIEVGENTTLEIGELNIAHTSTARPLYGEVDPESLARVTVTGTMTVSQTASVPPRVEVPLEIASTAQLLLLAGTGITFRDDVTIAGGVDVQAGARIDVDTDVTTVSSTASLSGEGLIEVSPNGTVDLTDVSDVTVSIDLVGTLNVSGDNRAGDISVNGGSVTGPGTLEARVRFDPDSPSQEAEVIAATVKLRDGSTWMSGSIRAIDGGQVIVPEDQRFTVDHTATNLQFADDGDPSDVEGLFVQGLLSIERSGSVPPGFNLPVTVTPEGTFEVQPNMRATFPGVLRVEGTLRLRDGSDARFIFNVHEIATGGRVEGNGSITVQLGGTLDIDGTVAPGENGEVGNLTYNGAYAMGPTATLEIVVVPGVDTSTLTVNGATTVDGSLITSFTESPPLGEESFLIVSSPGTPSGGFTTIDVVGASGTAVTAAQQPGGIMITATTSTRPGSISGQVFIERDGVVAYSPADRVFFEDFELTRFGPKTGDTLFELFAGQYEFRDCESGVHEVVVNTEVPYLAPVDPPLGRHEVFVDGDDVSHVDFTYKLVPEREWEVSSDSDGGPGSMRTVLTDIAASPEQVHAIRIDMPTEILLQSPLPRIGGKTLLIGDWDADEASRGGAFLVLDGSHCEGCDGLVLDGPGTTLAGVTLRSFDGYGLVIEGGETVLAFGNTITGNGAGGVLIEGGNRHALFGADPSRANVISGNGGPGITVVGGRGHALAGNVIEDNAGLAIDLGGDGVTPNDDLDVDLGPNDLQNSPEITGVNVDGTMVEGILESRALTTYTIDVYGNATCHASGTGQPTVHLASEEVTTDASGVAVFAIVSTPFEGELSATATDPDGSTSELSACFTADILETDAEVPMVMMLPVGHPNPMRTSWALSFAIPEVTPVDARIFDVTGRLVRELHQGSLPAGAHRVAWDGLAEGGWETSAGVYFYELRIGGIPHRGRVIRVE